MRKKKQDDGKQTNNVIHYLPKRMKEVAVNSDSQVFHSTNVLYVLCLSRKLYRMKFRRVFQLSHQLIVKQTAVIM